MARTLIELSYYENLFQNIIKVTIDVFFVNLKMLVFEKR